MITKQSNNILPIIHRLVTDEYGENYWFNGCARYVMEGLGETDYDYWFFAGITGEIFTQHYSFAPYSGDALSSYRMDENPAQFVEEIFGKCGYDATFVSKKELRKNSAMYVQTLMAYVDKGIPVIKWDGMQLGVWVGYEDYGKVLLYITGHNNQPDRIPLEEALSGTVETEGWVFVGDKKFTPSLAGLYREAIEAIPRLQAVRTPAYCFGAEAFRVWADDLVRGKFDTLTPEEFDPWSYYTNYVCVLATNSGCGQGFLQKAEELNPELTDLKAIREQYRITGLLWNGYYDANDTFAADYAKSHADSVAANLEAIGGGFNITLKVLQDKPQRERIAVTLNRCADCMEEIARIIRHAD